MRIVQQLRGNGSVSQSRVVRGELPTGMLDLAMWVGPSLMTYKGQLSSQSSHVVVSAPKIDWARRTVTISIAVKQADGIGLPAVGDFQGSVALPMLIGHGPFDIYLTDAQGRVLRQAKYNSGK